MAESSTAATFDSCPPQQKTSAKYLLLVSITTYFEHLTENQNKNPTHFLRRSPDVLKC